MIHQHPRTRIGIMNTAVYIVHAFADRRPALEAELSKQARGCEVQCIGFALRAERRRARGVYTLAVVGAILVTSAS